MKRYWLIVIFFALTLACRSRNQATRVKTEMNKQENTQINQETQPVLTHVEDSVGKLNIETAMVVNSEFIQSIEPEIAVTGGPQGRMIEETEPKETLEASKTDIIETTPQKAGDESQFIVFVGSEPEIEIVNEYGPFIVDVDQDAPQATAKGSKTVISTIQKIVGISVAQESNELGTNFIEVSETESKVKN